MKNVKRRPIPDMEQRRQRKKSKPFAIHKHQPSGSKIGMHGGELDKANAARKKRRIKGQGAKVPSAAMVRKTVKAAAAASMSTPSKMKAAFQ